MMRLVLNDAEQVLTIPPAHWGELLKDLEGDAHRRGEVVTAVRFDGVDQPTFRQEAATERGLSGMTLIELETATPDDLLDAALAEGATAAVALSLAAGQTGAAFRAADLGEANQRITGLGEGIRSLIWILGAVATARKINLDEIEVNGRAMSAQLAELTAQLESIVEAQRGGDWLTVADILEYDFQPSLQAWHDVFEGLRLTPATGVATK